MPVVPPHVHTPVFTKVTRPTDRSIELHNVCEICGLAIQRERSTGPWATAKELALRRDPIPAKPDRINVYVCEKCGAYTVTVDLHQGHTPYMIQCHTCSGMATSWGYPTVRPIPAYLPHPAWEWHKPSGEGYVKLSPEMRSYIDQGGLALRPRSPSSSDVDDLAVASDEGEDIQTSGQNPRPWPPEIKKGNL